MSKEEDFHFNQCIYVSQLCKEFIELHNIKLELKVEEIDTEYRSWYKEIIFYFSDKKGYGSLIYYSKNHEKKIESNIKDLDDKIAMELIEYLSKKINFIE